MLHYIMHGKHDTVGVAVVDVGKDKTLTGWNMEQDKTVGLKSRDAVPLGHKIALTDIAKGERVIKYNEEIGLASREIKKGQHVHTHNLKTARW